MLTQQEIESFGSQIDSLWAEMTNAATTHELVDAAVAGKIAELYEIFSRMNL